MLVALEGETLLACNDARLSAPQARRARLALGGEVDLLTVNVANPTWHPLCYEYPHAVQLDIARRKLLTRLQVVRRLLRVTRPRLTVPMGGPPVFLDPELAHFNRWIATPDVIPAPNQVQLAFREHDSDYAFTTLLPGDRCLPRSQLVLTDSRWGTSPTTISPATSVTTPTGAAVELSRVYLAHPEPDDSLGERFAAHFRELAGLSRYFLEHIDMTVRFEVDGPSGGRWDVHLHPDDVRVDLKGRASEVQYRFRVEFAMAGSDRHRTGAVGRPAALPALQRDA